jgi:uncharacterized membrane protein
MNDFLNKIKEWLSNSKVKIIGFIVIIAGALSLFNIITPEQAAKFGELFELLYENIEELIVIIIGFFATFSKDSMLFRKD